MSTNIHRESATIYQFPIGGRAGVVRQRDERSTGEYLASLGACETVGGGSWYHEEAMQAELGHKN
jgi:hypothetical protein